MLGSDKVVDVTPLSDADAFADRFQAARGARHGHAGFTERAGRPLTDFINGFFKFSLGVAILALVGIGCVFAFNTLEPNAIAAPSDAASQAPGGSPELDVLRSEVALLTEQSLALRAELELLTGQGGVLAKLVARLQEQRRVNGAHSNAIRQLYSTTGLIGASLPSVEDTTEPDRVGARPVQVTPVAAPENDTPMRVVLIPQGETAATDKTKGEAGE